MKRTIYIAFALCSLAALAASCTSSARFTSEKSPEPSVVETVKTVPDGGDRSKINRNKIIRKAEEFLGTPYCYGGESLVCTDCSGFTLQVFAEFGIELPRTAADQFNFCSEVSAKHAEAGDLVFFSNGRKISHVGIYAGGGMFIHASSSKGVRYETLSEGYFSSKFAGFGRVPESA